MDRPRWRRFTKKIWDFVEKALDKEDRLGYNNKAVSDSATLLPDCVKVARQTLTLFVWVRILVGQPWRGRQGTPCLAPSFEGALPLYQILVPAWRPRHRKCFWF